MVSTAIMTILVVCIGRGWERSKRLRALAQARHAAALKVYKEAARLYPGEIDVEELYSNARLLLEAEKDLDGPAVATKAHLDRMRKFQEAAELAWSKMRLGNPGLNPAYLDLYVKEAELWAAEEN